MELAEARRRADHDERVSAENAERRKAEAGLEE